MTTYAIRTKKARSTGRCPLCGQATVVGQQIADITPGWAHSNCAMQHLRNPTRSTPTNEGDPAMAGDTQITVVGNLVEDPNLRFTPSGQAVASFRIASTPRFLDKQTNEWKDGDSLFLTCNVWRQPAEHCAESLQRGMRVIVSGRLKQRSYETREGEKRTVYEIEVDDIGPSLKNATAKVTKAQRQGGNARPQQQPSKPADDPWATGGQPATTGGGFSDEPPF